MFKVACLSYQPGNVTYREQQLTRQALVALRRELVDKITAILPNSKLFRDGAMYPRRYFDDLVLQQRMNQETTRLEHLAS